MLMYIDLLGPHIYGMHIQITMPPLTFETKIN